jgi:hypothetical protein
MGSRLPGRNDVLRIAHRRRHHLDVDEESDDMTLVLQALFDIRRDVRRIANADDDEEEEEDD